MNRIKIYSKRLWNSLTQGLMQVFSASVLNNIISMLSNMIITRILSQAEYGIWSYVLNIYSYMVLITGFGLLTGAFQFGVENKGKKEEFQYYKFCLKMGVIIDTILVIVFCIFTFQMKFPISEAQFYLRIAVPMLIFEYILNLFLTILRCENRLKEYAKVLNINTILIMLGTCVGAFGGVNGIIAGKYIAYIFSLCYLIGHIKNEVKKIYVADDIPFRKTGSLWHYSIFTGTQSALNCLIYLIGVSMVASLIREPGMVAVYKVATLIPNALTFIPTSVVTCIMPDIVKNNKNYDWLRRNVKKYFLGLGILNSLVCGVSILFAPYIITILSGKEYLGAVPIFRILVLSYFVNGTFRSLSVNILAALRCVNYALFVGISSAVFNIVFNYIFILKYGVAGAAYATLAVVIVAAILSFFYVVIKLSKKHS